MALCPSTRASDTSSEMVHDWYVDLCCFRYPLFYVLNQNKGSGVKTLFQSIIHFIFCNIISQYMISLSWIHPWSDGYIWDLCLYHTGELTWIFGILGVPPLWNWFCWCHHPCLHWAVREGFLQDRQGFTGCPCSAGKISTLPFRFTELDIPWASVKLHLLILCFISRLMLRSSSPRCKSTLAALPRPLSHKNFEECFRMSWGGYTNSFRPLVP